MMKKSYFIILLLLFMFLISCYSGIGRRTSVRVVKLLDRMNVPKLDTTDKIQLDAKKMNQIKNGYKDGVWIEFIDSIGIQITEFKMGKMEGNQIVLYKDGARTHCKYYNNKKDGKCFYYTLNGFKYKEAIFKDDSLQSVNSWFCPPF